MDEFSVPQYASVSKAILKEGPTVCTALEKHDSGLEKMLADHTTNNDPANQKGRISEEEEQRHTEIANKLVRNRAKVQHTKAEMERAIQEVDAAGRKIVNVNMW